MTSLVFLLDLKLINTHTTSPYEPQMNTTQLSGAYGFSFKDTAEVRKQFLIQDDDCKMLIRCS